MAFIFPILLGLTGGAAAFAGSAKAVASGVVSTGTVGLVAGSTGHAISETVKGNGTPSIGESLKVGAFTAVGASVGQGLGPAADLLTSTTVKSVAKVPFASPVTGKIHFKSEVVEDTVGSPKVAATLSGIAGSTTEVILNQLSDD